MPLSAAVVVLHGCSFLFVSGEGGGRHNNVLSPTGCPFTRSNDVIIDADVLYSAVVELTSKNIIISVVSSGPQ